MNQQLSPEPVGKEALIIGGKKRRVNKSLTAWVKFVKKVAKEEKLTYRDAMMRAKVRKDKGEKWMSGGNNENGMIEEIDGNSVVEPVVEEPELEEPELEEIGLEENGTKMGGRRRRTRRSSRRSSKRRGTKRRGTKKRL
jgi:hypothetical protein